MPEKASLLLIKDGTPSTVFFLDPEETVTLGRSTECAIILKDAGCSRVHASIAQSGAGWELTDNGSRNGTALNGERIQGTVPIKNGDKIQLAHTLFHFCLAETSAPTAELAASGTDSLEWSQQAPATISFSIDPQREELTSQLSRERDEKHSLLLILERDTQIIGKSLKMRQLHEQISRTASSSSTTLICGESGVGKELVARAIHFGGSRRNKPLVCLNCAALSESLLESELFGHEKGAFTGASERKIGKFEAADKGTLFLDEIAEMHPSLQAKFLRVLEGHPFERVGGNKQIEVDVHVIAATNRDLKKEVQEGRFRRDLFYRLSVVDISVPPLRERGDDVLLLADHFLRRFSIQLKRKFAGFTPEAVDLLRNYRWPGNVRELKNAVERAVLFGTPPLVTPDDLPLSALPTPTDTIPAALAESPLPLRTIAETEKDLILRTLEYYNGNKSKSAQSLGIDRSTLDRKLARYNIEPKTP